MSSVPLYGGAAEMYLPPGYFNVSMIREVPDTQEVFANLNSDQALIVELLEHESGKADGFDALAHFAQDIAEGNGATEPLALDPQSVTTHQVCEAMRARTAYCGSISFVQRVAKFREHAANSVLVIVGLIRLPSVATDVVVSLSSPLSIDAASSSAATATRCATPQEAAKTLDAALSSFVVRRWSLFDAS